MKLKLFVDLDGVLADFDGGVLALTGKLPRDLEPKRMWGILARAPGFYANLAWTPGGRGLWERLRPHRPTVLTGLPMGKWAEPQKLAWCARELGPDVPVVACMSREKAAKGRALTPQDAVPVLIDDRESLGEAWTAMGGVFIHHKDPEASAAAFESLAGGNRATIRPLRLEIELPALRRLINEAFLTVAEEFGLTSENAPTNPAFITEENILEQARKKSTVFYGAYLAEELAGCYALEKANEAIWYLERLAVHPSRRHAGLGGLLLDDCLARVRESGGEKVSIAIIDENTRLKTWYIGHGFTETGKKTFPRLPFTVCFLEKNVR